MNDFTQMKYDSYIDIGVYSKFFIKFIVLFAVLLLSVVLVSKANAAPGDLLLTINNPESASGDYFGFSNDTTLTGDLLVGASKNHVGADDAGSVYLFDGTTGALKLTINNPTPESSDFFGYSVATTPAGDLFVGAFGDNTGADDAGSVYLFDGTTGALKLTINNPAPEASDDFGRRVAVTPAGDLLVGADGDNTGADDAGSVYLFDGTTGALKLTINNPAPEAGDWFGFFVDTSLAGDLLVGAVFDDAGADDAGSVYLFDGTTGALKLTINNPAPEAGDNFGISVTSVSNGNILVGAFNDNAGADDAGSAYLFDGMTGTLLLTLNNPDPDERDQFGASTETTPAGDLLISAYNDDTDGRNTGLVYLLDGTTGELLLTIHSPRQTSYDQLGTSLATTQNNDLFIGAHTNGPGYAYLFEGVLARNSAPTINPIGNQTVAENQTLQFIVTATDPDQGDVLTFSATNTPAGSSFDVNTGIFTWTPGFDDAGNYTDVEFTVTDDGDPIELDVELITITVGDINRAPVFTNPGPQQVLEGETLTFGLNAVDPDGNSVSVAASNTPIGAMFSTSTNLLTWAPNLAQEGIYTITFIATDNGVPAESATLDVVITVGDNPTPTEQAEDLVDDVIVVDLSNNVENSYLANLQKVEKFIADGQIRAALNQLNAFINKVEQDFSQGELTQQEHDNLIVAANNLIADLNGS